VKRPRIKYIKIGKRRFIKFIHLNFIAGIVYAFYHFIRTPKSVDMPTRRLWAAETWLIFTLYSVFIYLFIVETDAESGKAVIYELFKIRRYIDIRKPKKDIVKVFEFITKNPQKYKFDTHKGIFPLKGQIAKPGSIFYTKEVFMHIPLTLTFSTLGTTDSSFEFKLIKPFRSLEISGEFKLEKTQVNKFRLFLTVYSENRNIINHVLLSIIFISPVRMLIAKQLTKELKFVEKLF
jgi:hypothetical protein